MPPSLKSVLEKWLFDPKWRIIYRLGNAKILGASFASFVFIYLIARVIGHGQSWLHNLGSGLLKEHPLFGIWLNSVSADLTLPLGLKLLAYSAIFAVIGKGIYEARCPPYIKQGDSLDQFRNAYSDALSILANDFQDLWNNNSAISFRQSIFNDVKIGHLINFYFVAGGQQNQNIPVLANDSIIQYRYVRPHPGAGTGISWTGNLMTMVRYKDFGTAIFDLLREHRDNCNRPWRITCAASYYFAIFFAAAAVLYQAWWVLPLLR
jgi:hypothetical protein